ncbi:hypothetical protein [Streptomyces sp. NPDC005046]
MREAIGELVAACPLEPEYGENGAARKPQLTQTGRRTEANAAEQTPATVARRAVELLSGPDAPW